MTKNTNTERRINYEGHSVGCPERDPLCATGTGFIQPNYTLGCLNLLGPDEVRRQQWDAPEPKILVVRIR